MATDTELSYPANSQSSNTDIEDILENIDGHIHGPISGFVLIRHDVIEKANKIRNDCRIILSGVPPPEALLQWFSDFSLETMSEASSKWHVVNQHPDAVEREALLVLTRSNTFDPKEQTNWRHVESIGSITQSKYTSYRDGLLTLCGHAQEVFASQPTRLFLHGLYIHGSLMEVWVFDQSGIYCCEKIKIQDDFLRFVSVLISYRLMNERDLGKSDIVKDDGSNIFITLEHNSESSLQKLFLEPEPIASSDDLVGQGTTCFRARMSNSDQWRYVVKLKWRLASDRPEATLLKLAKDRKAWGIVSLDYYREIENTSSLRQSLHFGPYRKFLTDKDQAQRSNDLQALEEKLEAASGGVNEYTEETDKSFEGRVFTCIVISPAGRPLRTFKTRLELLKAFRDAIKAHRSLFQQAKILHQDVSPQNIIIVDAQKEEDPHGILIDLDVAMDISTGPRTPGEVTGTRPFMSIGILKRRRHTYRHDLESFLYVILWTVIANEAENPPPTSRLRQWSRGSWDDSVTLKTHDMNEDNFTKILDEFAPDFNSFKPLAETMRQILFPIEDGSIWTGTNGALNVVNGIYDGIIDGFQEVICQEEKL